MALRPDLPPVAVVGLHGGQWFGRAAEDALTCADVVVGAARQHHALGARFDGERVDLAGPLDAMIDLIEERRSRRQQVVVLASGDPGFFGIERLLVGRFGDAVEVHPAPSSVALAFARARVPWDDAAVVSAHGRSLDRALPHILAAPTVAVLVSPTTPPEAIGRALLDAGSTHRRAWVCSRLGEADEVVTRTDLAGLAEGAFDPLSVLVLTSDPTEPDATDAAAPPGVNSVLAWGRPEGAYHHRDGMITKSEVRAVALSKLDLYGAATMWDVGAASGSVGIEAARLAPGLRVYAVERDAEDCERIRANAVGVALTVVEGEAPRCLDNLPDPDRAFVGGGGADVLDAVVERVAPGGIVVAAFAIIETAVHAAARLGNLVQVSVSRGRPIGGDGRLRLDAENPVFVVWGQT